MNDKATLQVMRRTAAEVERKEDCVKAMRTAGQRPSDDFLDELRDDLEFLSYLNEVVNTPRRSCAHSAKRLWK